MKEEKILVVDDEASIRETTQRFLVLAGYSVTTMAGGAEAIEACRQNPFALVLTDLKMPGMSGEELLHHIKEITPTTDVVIMTGYPTLESAILTLKAGAYDYLLKPFELAELEKVVQRCLERQRLKTEWHLGQKFEELSCLKSWLAQVPDLHTGPHALTLSSDRCPDSGYEPSELLANVCHRRPTPLTALIGDADLAAGCSDQILKDLHKAVLDQRRVIVRYDLDQTGKLREYTLDPYQIYFKRRALYLDAFCPQTQEYLVLQINYIKEVRPTRILFSRQANYSFTRRHRNAEIVFVGEKDLVPW